MTNHEHNHELSADHSWDEATAKWYIEEYGEHPFNRMTVERANPQQGEWILDIGCGSGAALRAAADHVTEGALIGVDPSAFMVEAAQRLSTVHAGKARLKFTAASAEDLPFPKSWFDMVMAINSFHHWTDISRGLQEVAHVLKREGRLILVEEIFEENDRGLTSEQIVELLTSSGFEVIATDRIEAEDADALYFEAQMKRE